MIKVEEHSKYNWIITTDLPPEAVNQVGRYIAAKWVAFALGSESLNNRRIIYPSGRYAAAIKYKNTGFSEFTIAVPENMKTLPEALMLESGHGEIDLKKKLQQGKAYKMHRESVDTNRGPGRRTTPEGLLRTSFNTTLNATQMRRTRSTGKRAMMYIEMRKADATGYASFGPNSKPESWIIPAMPAYSPSKVLADLAVQAAQRLGS